MSIKNNLAKVHVVVVIDTFKAGSFGRLLRAAAINALTKGIGSDEWKEYMSLFADNNEQLMRLTVEDDNEPGWFKESRAYIVSNAICGADTTGQTGANVGDGFAEDPAVPDAPDGSVTKPFPVPEP